MIDGDAFDIKGTEEVCGNDLYEGAVPAVIDDAATRRFRSFFRCTPHGTVDRVDVDAGACAPGGGKRSAERRQDAVHRDVAVRSCAIVDDPKPGSGYLRMSRAGKVNDRAGKRGLAPATRRTAS